MSAKIELLQQVVAWLAAAGQQQLGGCNGAEAVAVARLRRLQRQLGSGMVVWTTVWLCGQQYGCGTAAAAAWLRRGGSSWRGRPPQSI